MHTELIYVIGASGHAKVVLDALLSNQVPLNQIRVRDDAPLLEGRDFLGCIIRTPGVVTTMAGQLFHLAIGSCSVRQRLFLELVALGALPSTVTHPRASVSRFAIVEDGAFVAARAIVAPGARVGHCVIVNHGAVVDHDCAVDVFSHIAPNATLGGGVKVGKCVLIGAGAIVLPGVCVGDGAVIGAGAVVTENVPAGEIHMGVPARKFIGG
jgi:sugar O-acyltransferase (sialic acid O-acetyltransferase NeuD family)